MGLFLQVALMPGCKEAEAREAVQAAAGKYSDSLDGLVGGDHRDDDIKISQLNPKECQYMETEYGVAIFFNDECIGYDSLAKVMSLETGKPCLMLYMYDGDYWGYWFYENGDCIDRFEPIPDYFEEPSEETIQKTKGDADIIAKYFHVDRTKIERYLERWTDELRRTTAYEEDEHCYGDDWQIVDFMGKLGYPWPSDEEIMEREKEIF